MAIIGKKVTCPFCFESFAMDTIKYRCTNARCKQREEDKVYAQARGLRSAPLMGHVYKPKKDFLARLRKSGSARCDACSKESQKRLCPHCHFELFHNVGEIDNHIIAIIGGRNTGKGHYIATLVHRLEQEVGTQFDFSLRMLGDDTRERFESEYRTPLFHRKTLLRATPSAVVDSSVKSPMIFRLTSNQGRKLRAINLSFFDSAGEDMQSLDTLSAEARYICHASGIIFLLDPLQINSIRQQVAEDMLPPFYPLAEPTYIVERLQELFERQLNLSATTKVKIPIAFVLSKVDTLFPLIDASSNLRMTGEHFGHFNLTDAQSTHTEIWNYLQSWTGGKFSNLVETGFENYHYFGTSSLGQPPDEKGNIATVSPIRVEDPFLWLLYQLGIIKGK